jgi:alcohol dehydrogenase class IV
MEVRHVRFEFATAGRILFGDGRLAEVGPLARQLGSRALVVTGAHPARGQGLYDLLTAAGVAVEIFSLTGEPTVEDALAGVLQAREFGCDLVIGFGGGSALDAAKAIAALTVNEGDIFEYLEVIGRAQPLTKPALPVIAIPTTAGTGSEVTRNAVLASAQHKVKVSVRSPHMLPRIALVDPLLTYNLPPAITAATGMDALTQLIEPYVSSRANPLTDGISLQGLRCAVRSLRRACQDGNDATARRDMAFASLCGGLALANAGLGAVHGFAGPFGGMYDAPHGAVCAALLAPVCAVNIQALLTRAPEHPSLARYAELATILTGDTTAGVEDGVEWLQQLCSELPIPPLSRYGFTMENASGLIPKAQAASSMKANPIPLTDEELRTVLAQAT